MTERGASLKQRFVLFISAVVILLSVALAAMFFINSRQLLNDELDRRGTLITQQLAHGADVGIVNNSLSYLDQKINNFVGDPDLAYVIFRRAEGSIIRDWYRERGIRDSISQRADVDRVSYRGYEIRHIAQPITSYTAALSPDLFAVFGEEASGIDVESKVETVGHVEVGISTENVHARLRQILNTGIIILVTGILLAILVSYFYIDFTTRPLKRMVIAAGNVAEGNLHDEIQIEATGEIADLANSFNFMLSNLRELFQNIKAASQKLSEVSLQVAGSSREVAEGANTQSDSIEDMSRYIKDVNVALKETKEMTDGLSVSAVESSSSINEMSMTINAVDESMLILNESVRDTNLSIEEIVASIAEVSSNVGRLTAAANETATSMLEIDSSIKQVEGNSRETTALSEKVQQDAERGRESVQKTIVGMNKIRESSMQIDLVISNLEEKTNRIGSILNVIDEIADQTNLLALNAAITAAQAGEQGRAFAVVADEIKELAERTSRSTAEIANLISGVQDESGNAVRAMEVGNRSIEAGVQLADAAGNALDEILTSAKRSSEMIHEISRATNEQAKGSHQVTVAISQIVEMCERIGQATQDQKARSQQIVEAAERMKNIADKVKRTTREQSQGSKLITAAIEKINTNISHISRNSDEQSGGSDRIVRSVETIREITTRNQQNVGNLEGVTEVLNHQTDTLMELLRRFKL